MASGCRHLGTELLAQGIGLPSYSLHGFFDRSVPEANTAYVTARKIQKNHGLLEWVSYKIYRLSLYLISILISSINIKMIMLRCIIAAIYLETIISVVSEKTGGVKYSIISIPSIMEKWLASGNTS